MLKTGSPRLLPPGLNEAQRTPARPNWPLPAVDSPEPGQGCAPGLPPAGADPDLPPRYRRGCRCPREPPQPEGTPGLAAGPAPRGSPCPGTSLMPGGLTRAAAGRGAGAILEPATRVGGADPPLRPGAEPPQPGTCLTRRPSPRGPAGTAQPGTAQPAAPLGAPRPDPGEREAPDSARTPRTALPRGGACAPQGCGSYLRPGLPGGGGRASASLYPRSRTPRLPIAAAAAALGRARRAGPLLPGRGSAACGAQRPLAQPEPAPRPVHRHTPRNGLRPIGYRREDRAKWSADWPRGKAAPRPAGVA